MATPTSACDSTTEGAIRYLDASNVIELCDDNAWIAIGSGGSLGIDDLIDAAAAHILANANYAQEWYWDTLSTETALTLGSNSMTTGSILSLEATNNTAQHGAALNIVNDTTGAGYGVYAVLTDATQNGGAAGYFSAAGTGWGVVGESNWGQGVYGSSVNGKGVDGQTTGVNGRGGFFKNHNTGVAVEAQSVTGTDSTILEVMRLDNEDTTSAGADGIGSALTFFNETETDGTFNEFARIAGVADDADNASRDGSLRFYTVGPNAASGAAATEKVRISPIGSVGIPPANEAIANNGTITADACGGFKGIMVTAVGANNGDVTTDTTNTFTAPSATNAGCCMDVANIENAGGTDDITLDDNANFRSASGSNITLTPGKTVRVCSNGTNWYQACGSLAIDALTDARYDTATDFNMALGTEMTFFSGAQYNLFIGQNSGNPGTSTAADNNTGVGYGALNVLTTGDQNTALGRNALTSTTTGASNTAVGRDAMNSNISGGSNVAIGYGAMFNADSSNNTALGYQAGDNITSGAANIIIGYNVDAPSATANSQLSIGNLIFATGGFGTGTTVGTGNIGIGVNNPGGKLTIGNGATAGGELRLMEDTDAGTNYASFALPAAGITANTVYTLPPDDGDAGEQLQTNGSGVLTWEAAGSGGGGSIDGLSDARYDTATDFNMALGTELTFYATGTGAEYNLFIGQNAGAAGSADTMDYNTGVGYAALDAITIGDRNTALGYSALSAITDGNRNTAVGWGALSNGGWAGENTTVGYASMGGGTTGGSAERNAAFGYQAFANLKNGDDNVAIGHGALSGNYGSGTGGDKNTAVGAAALSLVDPGAGTNALGNIGLGYQAGNNITTGNYNITIGYDIDAPSATANSQLSIGNLIFATGGFGTGTTVGAGVIGIGQPAPNEGKVEVKGGSVCVDTNSDNTAGSCIANESDVRLKRNVRDVAYGLATLMALRPVSFDWRHDDPEVLKHYDLISRFADKPHSIGLIAQDVQELVPEAIEQETIGDEEVQYLQLDYDKLIPVVIKAVQEQQSLIQDLKSENDALRARLDAMEASR